MKNRFVQLLIVLVSLSGCRNAEPAETPGSNIKPPVVTASFTFADKAIVNRYESAIQAFMQRNFGNRGFNGSYLIAKDGQIITEEYVGYRDPVLKDQALQEHDAFHLASVSKTFTGMAVLKLWEEGKLSLDDELSRYFEKFPYKNITVKMLLNHRSGLPNYTNYLDVYGWNKKKLASNLDVLASLYKMRPPIQFTAGRRFSYCNTNYALLALIIEKISGQSFPEFMDENFFIPLQMNDTYVFRPEDANGSMPSFEANNRRYGMEFMDLVYGDKNVYSTVRDMLKWDQALYSDSLFKPETLEAAFQGYSYEKSGMRNYGLGWRLTELKNGKKIVYHNGWWHGNNTVFIRLPEEKATIIMLGNRYNRGIYKAKQLCDLFGDYQQSNNLFQDPDADGSVSVGGGSE
ncbi:serine hydrolase domain-containing protein [Flavihumibacter sp. UBA7668]|uniref:serine hydrolase domain-containing protein n=1 Tax=Flavihumibacter sp. UBA7668 TaxID=1946542 RepID=UPI0025C4872B|nr:serine hydrolase domain-containing protein [Flavihumibacter sp. UBA7668]